MLALLVVPLLRLARRVVVCVALPLVAYSLATDQPPEQVLSHVHSLLQGVL